MIKGIYVAARGLDARMKNLESVANNLANLNTTGYKSVLPFTEVMNQLGEVKVQQATDYTQGDLIQTSNPLDLAISGNGFFVMQTDNGETLTRDGSFQVSDSGFLVDKDGNKVMGKSGPVNISRFLLNNKETVTIAKDGEVKVGSNVVDKLLIAKPNDPQDVQRLQGSDINSEGGYQVVDENNFTIKQGYLEASNVNPIKEMEAMIQLNSEYQSSQKMINFLDQSLNEANQIGKV
jgi:flagellar basal-body rod protein FlgF